LLRHIDSNEEEATEVEHSSLDTILQELTTSTPNSQEELDTQYRSSNSSAITSTPLPIPETQPQPNTQDQRKSVFVL
jgi:hypothetical protein